MHVLPPSGPQALTQNRIHELQGRSVIQRVMFAGVIVGSLCGVVKRSGVSLGDPLLLKICGGSF